DEKVSKFGWEPYTSKDVGINFIENIAPKFQLCKAICLNDRAIGSIMIYPNLPYDKSRSKSAELGYVLGSEYWGKGIPTCAVKQIVKVVFSELSHLERLEAIVDVENVGSQRVLEKVGFQKEGVLGKYWLLKGKSRDTINISLHSTDLQL
ncbi:putative N-acetyltransferase, partial [Trifolium medium]|nr:putative N-acetyltransferase [Trifolium medium]